MIDPIVLIVVTVISVLVGFYIGKQDKESTIRIEEILRDKNKYELELAQLIKEAQKIKNKKQYGKTKI